MWGQTHSRLFWLHKPIKSPFCVSLRWISINYNWKNSLHKLLKNRNMFVSSTESLHGGHLINISKLIPIFWWFNPKFNDLGKSPIQRIRTWIQDPNSQTIEWPWPKHHSSLTLVIPPEKQEGWASLWYLLDLKFHVQFLAKTSCLLATETVSTTTIIK